MRDFVKGNEEGADSSSTADDDSNADDDDSNGEVGADLNPEDYLSVWSVNVKSKDGEVVSHHMLLAHLLYKPLRILVLQLKPITMPWCFGKW